MRRLLVPLLALALLGAACGEPTGPSDDPTTSTTAPSPSPDPTSLEPLPGSSCEPQGGGSFDNVPDFVDVELEHVDGIDRITFVLELSDPDAAEPPSYNVQFVEQLTTDGEGAPVDVEGEEFLQISFNAVGTRIEGETPEPVYTGPEEFVTDFTTLLEAEQLGDFENVITWGLGLSLRACPRVVAERTSITIELPATP
ncbi:MAG: hypothetical protein WD770_00290 [Actinomycetota bacterium]